MIDSSFTENIVFHFIKSVSEVIHNSVTLTAILAFFHMNIVPYCCPYTLCVLVFGTRWRRFTVTEHMVGLICIKEITANCYVHFFTSKD